MLNGKENETRNRITSVRGIVLICAGLSYYKTDQLVKMCGDIQYERLLYYIGGDVFKLYRENRGKAIGVGRLVNSYKMRRADADGAFVRCDNDLYVHKYIEVRPIKPFPYTGKQGWSILTDEQKKLIELL